LSAFDAIYGFRGGAGEPKFSRDLCFRPGTAFNRKGRPAKRVHSSQNSRQLVTINANVPDMTQEHDALLNGGRQRVSKL
jgi:hypothetical protein